MTVRSIRLLLLFLILLPFQLPAITLTQVAAGTTIALNVLEIKQNWEKVRTAAKATKRVTKKVVKKVRGN